MILDEVTKQIIEDPDLNIGELRAAQIPVSYRYVLEKPAEYEEYVIAEYPDTGGQDIGRREVSPEVGYWEMLDENGEVLPYPIQIDTENFPKELEIPDVMFVDIYHVYTQDELEEIEEQRIEAEKAIEKQKVLEGVPVRVDTVEETQDDIVLLLADIVGGAV